MPKPFQSSVRIDLFWASTVVALSVLAPFDPHRFSYVAAYAMARVLGTMKQEEMGAGWRNSA